MRAEFLFTTVLMLFAATIDGWLFPRVTSSSSRLSSYGLSRGRSLSAAEITPEMDVVAMSVDEIKAELELRDVDFSDCLSKQELVQRLQECRVSGKADPELLKNFNEMNPDEVPTIDDALLDDVSAKDGTLPGGLSKEMLKALASDPEIMQMLRDPKMQDIMSAVMSGGPDAFKKFAGDPDALMVLERLSKVMGKFMGNK